MAKREPRLRTRRDQQLLFFLDSSIVHLAAVCDFGSLYEEEIGKSMPRFRGKESLLDFEAKTWGKVTERSQTSMHMNTPWPELRTVGRHVAVEHSPALFVVLRSLHYLCWSSGKRSSGVSSNGQVPAEHFQCV